MDTRLFWDKSLQEGNSHSRDPVQSSPLDLISLYSSHLLPLKLTS